MAKKKKHEKVIEILKCNRSKEEIASREHRDISLIESILVSCIEKLQIMLALPTLLADPTSLKKLMTDNEWETIYPVLTSFLEKKDQINQNNDIDDSLLFFTYNDENLEVLFNSYVPDPNKGVNESDKLFQTTISNLFCNSKILRVCEHISHKISPEGKMAIEVLTRVKKFIINRMITGPNVEFQREKGLSDMFIYNDWAKDEIAVLSRKFTIAMDKQAEKIGKKCKDANQIQQRTDVVVEHGKEMARFFGRTADNKMIWERKKSEYIQENLSKEISNLKTLHDQYMNNHLGNEKALRMKRYKTESQLLTVLKKYDIDVKDRDKMYSELNSLYEEEQEQLRLLKEKFDLQSTEYHALMDEKDEYEFLLWEERLYNVQKTFAARKIQKYYRAYVALCTSAGYSRFKKKGKGKKKKK